MRFGEVTRCVLIACPRDFAALLKLLMSCYASKYRICNQGVVGSNPHRHQWSDQAVEDRRKLGDTTGSSLDQDLFPDKPLQMRWMTYCRLKDRYERLEEQAGAGMIMRVEDG